MICREPTPVTFPLPRLNRRTTSSPNVSSATARLNAFSCGYRDAVPLTGVQHQKALSRPVSVFIKTGRHVGGTGFKMRRYRAENGLAKRRPFARMRGRRIHDRYDRWKKRVPTAIKHVVNAKVPCLWHSAPCIYARV